MPISGKNLCRLFQKAGYKIVPGGKGSHIKLKKQNCPTVIIPNHKELSKGLEHDLRKILEQITKGV
jgi:predicted RNA binding protein YcfA (HicA-like mRNA interferase family)